MTSPPRHLILAPPTSPPRLRKVKQPLYNLALDKSLRDLFVLLSAHVKEQGHEEELAVLSCLERLGDAEHRIQRGSGGRTEVSGTVAIPYAKFRDDVHVDEFWAAGLAQSALNISERTRDDAVRQIALRLAECLWKVRERLSDAPLFVLG